MSGECSSWVVFNGSGADLEFRSAGECWYRPNGYIGGGGGGLLDKKTTYAESYYWSGTWFSGSDGNYVYCYRICIRENSGSSTGIKYTADPEYSTDALCRGYFVRCMKKQ